MKRASFGTEWKKPIYCANHKLPEMTDVMNKRCEFAGCDKQPSFGTEWKKPIYCANHKLPEMKDIKHRLCQSPHCSSRPTYGNPGRPLTHCRRHRQVNMIRRSNGKCRQCNSPAFYGRDFIPSRCEVHKIAGDTNYLERECVSCGLLNVLNDKGTCEFCDPETFQIGRLKKQNELFEYLDSRNLHGTSSDRPIDGGECGQERPDRVFETDTFVLILECDEFQHQNRACLCEQTRMVNIGQAYGGLPVYFIRWNPDEYIPLNPRANLVPLANRHKLVADLIRSILNGRTRLPSHLVSAIYLFYDDWSNLKNEEWTPITEFSE